MNWISVKDKLPELRVNVLCYAKAYSPDAKTEQHVGRRFPGENFWILGSSFSFDVGEVTHWMPLPEPPIERGAGDDYPIIPPTWK